MSQLRAVAEIGALMMTAAHDEPGFLSAVVSAVANGLTDTAGEPRGALDVGRVTGALVRRDQEPLLISAVPGPAGWLLENATAGRTADAGTEEVRRWPARGNDAGGMVAPMMVRGRMRGSLAVEGVLTDSAADFIAAAAAAAASAVDHARVLVDTLELLESARRQGEVLEHVSDAIISCDSDGLVVGWNAGAERLYGYPAADAVGCDLFALLATRFHTTDGVEVDTQSVLDHVAGTGGWNGELHERRADAEALIVLCAMSELRDADGDRVALILVNRDVTEQRQHEHSALHDPLTGLANRRRLLTFLTDAIARLPRSRGPLAVLFLDLNRFKPINDEHGHAVGDELLVATAVRLRGAVRTSDMVARIGGDEFVVVLQDAGSAEDVQRVLARIQLALAAPVVTQGPTLTVSSSIGVVLASAPAGAAVSPQRLLQCADEAMYQAKRAHTGVAWGEVPADTGAVALC